EVRVEARRHAPGARGGRDEIDGAGVPAGASQRRPGRALAQLEGAAAKTRAQLVHRLVGTERGAVDEEVAARDVAGLEEPAAARVVVAGHAEQLRLREALGGGGRGDRGNAWNVHAGSPENARLA